jgi:hypothetical protein
MKKKELTTVKNVRHIRAPLIQGATELIEKTGVKSSPFILDNYLKIILRQLLSTNPIS